MILFKRLTAIFALSFILLFANSVSFFAQVENSGSSVYELQPGTKITVRMANEINSKSFGVGDTFIVRVAEPLVIRNVVVLPAEAIIEGRITEVKRASLAGKDGDLEVLFETLRLEEGTKLNIEGVLVNKLKAESSYTPTILAVIGGTAIGALIGTVTGSDNGALIGAGLGAGAGTGTALLRKGKDVRIKTDENFEIEITKKVTLPARDF